MSIKVGSDFSGVGAFEQALNRLGIEHEVVFACDKDKYARLTYVHNYGEPEYYPDDVYDREIPAESLDIYMTSPPCQSFSLAGKRLGKDDKRGILFFNSHEFITKNEPRYFIFENVKGLLSDDGGKTFSEWLHLLGGKSVNGMPIVFPYDGAVPYHVYWKVLNAKDFGVPQNRERVFIIGIRDDIDNDFSFPKEIPLTRRLKDVLESEVDEKYYLSDKMIEYLNQNTINNKEKGNGFQFKPKTELDINANAITTKAGSRMDDNYIQETPTLKQVGSLSGGKWDKINESARRYYDTDGISPTIHTCNGGNTEPKIEVVQINPSLESGGVQPYQQNRVYESNGMSPALCHGKSDLLVTEDIITHNMMPRSSTSGKGGTGHLQGNDGIAYCLDTGNTNAVEFAENWIQGGLQQNQPKQTNGISPCLTSAMGMGGGQTPIHNYGKRIRKLTPRECANLMDFPPEFDLSKVSNSQAYKQMGNSIVVAVLAAIINKLKL